MGGGCCGRGRYYLKAIEEKNFKVLKRWGKGSPLRGDSEEEQQAEKKKKDEEEEEGQSGLYIGT